MSQKSSNTKPRESSAEEKSKGSGVYKEIEIITVFTIFAGIFTAISTFTDAAGTVGVYVRNLLFGIFGAPAYIACLFIICIGVDFAITKTAGKYGMKYILSFIMMALAAALWHIFSHNAAVGDNLYNLGKKGIGGGVIGGNIARPLIKSMGFLGGVCFIISMIIVCFISVFDISVLKLFGRVFRLTARLLVKIFKRGSAKSNAEPSEPEDEKSILEKIHDNQHKILMAQELDMLKQRLVRFEEVMNDMPGNPKEAKSERQNKKSLHPQAEDASNHDEPDKVFSISEIVKAKKEQKLREYEKEMAIKQEMESIEKKLVDSMQIHSETAKEYSLPPVDLLNTVTQRGTKNSTKMLEDTARKLISTLDSFGVDVKIVDYSLGPTVTRYELAPSAGVKISKILNLADDIALNLAAVGVRIEAPIPGKAALGIEIPNTVSKVVSIKEVINHNSFSKFESKTCFALGKDIGGNPVIVDISKMPHLLIAGSTGSGKSVCINTLITSILYKAKPDEVKLIMIDPKMVELGGYNGIPHLLIPVVTDPHKAAGALQWTVKEMTNRYKLFAENKVRDIKGYNNSVKNTDAEPMPQIVIIIDELADLMMVASKDVEDSICRLAQMARAAGMHLVIATQRPSVDVLTGIIKANIPSRISFAVSSQIDSRTILDMAGAEKLLGRGDMLYSPIGSNKPMRVQGAFVSDEEVSSVVEFVKNQFEEPDYDQNVIEQLENFELSGGVALGSEDDSKADELLPQAIEMALDAGQASVAMYQRRLKVGYQRAARLIDQMEERGVIGGFEGSKPRQLLITRAQYNEMIAGDNSMIG